MGLEEVCFILVSLDEMDFIRILCLANIRGTADLAMLQGDELRWAILAAICVSLGSDPGTVPLCQHMLGADGGGAGLAALRKAGRLLAMSCNEVETSLQDKAAKAFQAKVDSVEKELNRSGRSAWGGRPPL